MDPETITMPDRATVIPLITEGEWIGYTYVFWREQ
jgi:hypothetical protein